MKVPWKSTSDDFKGFLDHGTSLTGELNFAGTLRVDGEIHGSITTSDILIVGESAMIHADIKAGEVHIHGAVLGNIDGNRRVDIYATGRLRGDVRTPQLVIEEGGVFEGLSRGATDSEGEEPARESFPAQTPKAKKRKEWPDRFAP